MDRCKKRDYAFLGRWWEKIYTVLLLYCILPVDAMKCSHAWYQAAIEVCNRYIEITVLCFLCGFMSN